MSLVPILRLAVWCLALSGAALCHGRARAQERPPAAPPVVTALAVSGDANRTELTITVSKAVEARALLMEQPERVVIELPEASFRLPADAGRRAQGLVASFRYGLFAHGRSRIVVDLAQPAVVSSQAVADPGPDGSVRLTLALGRAERQAFRKAVAADRPALERASAGAAREIAVQAGQRPVIVIDPGHGGVDPGAIAHTGDHEKDIVFGFATRLRERLEASGRYRIVMTRDHDVFIPLDERVRLGRAARADLFISIHADTITDAPQVRGLTVYTGAKQASDEASRHVAERENTADAAAGLASGEAADAVADILQELAVRETHGQSQRFARKLTGEIKPVMALGTKPHRQAGFRVLRAADVPAVLVELGYLSSRKDLELLTSSEWRERSTAAMATAIDRFFAPRLASEAPVAGGP